MEAIIVLAMFCLGLIIYVMKKDARRRARYEAWKKEKNLSTEDCGI